MAASLRDLDLAAVYATRDWLPDLFVALWPYLDYWMHPPDRATARLGIVDKPWKGEGCDEFEGLRRLMAGQAEPTVPEAVIQYLEGADPIPLFQASGRRKPTVTNRWERPLTVALAIESLLEAIHPWSTPRAGRARRVPRPLIPVRDFWLEHGRFNRSPDGLVLVPTSSRWVREHLPRDATFPRPSEPASIQASFKFLTVFEPGLDASRRIELKALNALGGPNPMAPYTPRVAVVPLAERKDDVSITTHSGAEDELRYEVSLDAAHETLLVGRIRTLIPALEAEGVSIAVFPELVVSPVVADSISHALRGLRRVPGARAMRRLEYVVAGSGSTDVGDRGPPHNRALVFDSDGRELWVQNKMNHYVMPAGLLDKATTDTTRSKKAVLASAIRSSRSYKEHMRVGAVLRVADGIFGRMVVAICEDLSQSQPLELLCIRLPPDWVFTPVMDTALAGWRWGGRRAFHLADSYGIRTVVANSLVVADADPHPSKDGQVGIGLCADRVDGTVHMNVLKVPQDAPASGAPRFASTGWDPSTWPAMAVGTKA